MLERVALGQARFMTPGVSPDPRGVLLGRYGLLLFSTLEGVVSWLRLYSAEASLDELLPALEIHQARTPLSSREMLVRLPATSSYTMDRAARCAKLVGGSLFTGTSKHFVKYRDDRSPYGYDAVDIHALPDGADIMLHGLDFTQTYTKEGELAFDKLLFRLSLRRVPGGHKLAPDQRSELLLAVARGLGTGVIRYLWRNRIEAQAGLIHPKNDSVFADLGADASYLLIRTRRLPERILDLFTATPGIDVFSWATPQAAVQIGFEHVIDLSSCASVFDGDQVHLFWGETTRDGRTDRVDALDGPLELSGIEHLTRVGIDVEQPRIRGDFDVKALSRDDEVGVPIRLAASLSPPRHIIGTLIPLKQRHMLKRLVYFLPQTSLRGHRVATTERGILLVGSEDIDMIPLGQLLAELAPGLLVPLGMDLVPRVAPSVLSSSLGHSTGMLTVFPHSGDPFQITESALHPLDRRALARIEVEPVEVLDAQLAPRETPSVRNDPVGRFSLWGFPAPPNRS